MTHRERCRKATLTNGKKALRCQGKVICSNQYYCEVTGQYENTPGYKKCKRLEEPIYIVVPKGEEIVRISGLQPGKTEVREPKFFGYVQNIVPKEQTSTEQAAGEAEHEHEDEANPKVEAQTEVQSAGVEDSSGTQRETDQESSDTTNKNESEGSESVNGQVRGTKRRNDKKS